MFNYQLKAVPSEQAGSSPVDTAVAKSALVG